MIAADATVDRPRCFLIAFTVLALNGAVMLAAGAVHARGWIASILNLFEISAILWCAAAAGVAILWRAPVSEPATRFDMILLGFCALAAMLFVPMASTAALTALCIWAVITTPAGSPLRRAALIFLAMTTGLLWGRLLLIVGSDVFLAGEAVLVSAVTGRGGEGNMVAFDAGPGFYTVAPGCSSLQGVSLAVVLWVTVTQYFEVSLGARAWAALAGAVVVAVATNLARLSTIALFPDYFVTLHEGLGATICGWIALVGIVAVVWWTLHDALVARA